MDGPGWSHTEVVVELDPTVRGGYTQHHVEVPSACCTEGVAGVRVEAPEELAAALAEHPELEHRWDDGNWA